MIPLPSCPDDRETSHVFSCAVYEPRPRAPELSLPGATLAVLDTLPLRGIEPFDSEFKVLDSSKSHSTAKNRGLDPWAFVACLPVIDNAAARFHRD